MVNIAGKLLMMEFTHMWIIDIRYGVHSPVDYRPSSWSSLNCGLLTFIMEFTHLWIIDILLEYLHINTRASTSFVKLGEVFEEIGSGWHPNYKKVILWYKSNPPPSPHTHCISFKGLFQNMGGIPSSPPLVIALTILKIQCC